MRKSLSIGRIGLFALFVLAACFFPTSSHVEAHGIVRRDSAPGRKLLAKSLNEDSFPYRISESLRTRKQNLMRRNLKQEEVPNQVEFNQDYVESIALIALPGLVMLVLFFVYAIIMSVITFCKPSCCSGNQHPPSVEVLKNRERVVLLGMVVNGFMIFLVALLVFGTAPYFSSGVDNVLDTVGGTVDTTVVVIEDVTNSTEALSTDIPLRMDGIVDSLSDVEVLLQEIDTLEAQLIEADSQIQELLVEVESLTLPPQGDLSETEQLINSVVKSAEDSAQVISDLQELATTIETEVLSIYQDMVDTIDSKKEEIASITTDIIDQLDEVLTKANEINDDVDKESEKASAYQDINAKGTAAFFVIPVVACLVLGVGLFFKNKPSLIAGFSLLFFAGIILWILFAIYLPVGVLLTDYCEEPYDILYEGLEYIDGDAGIAITGCFNRKSIFDSLEYEDDLQVSKYFDYNEYVSEYYAFRDEYNITELADYVDEVSSLTTYDVLADIEKLTPEAYGYDETVLEDALSAINTITVPNCNEYYTAANVTNLDPQACGSLSQDDIQTLEENKQIAINAIQTKEAIDESIAELTANLTRIQNSLDDLAAITDDIEKNFDDMEATLFRIDDAVAGVEVVMNQTQDDINEIADLCDCDYVADAYDDFVDTSCVTTISGVDVIWLTSVIIAGGIWTHLALSWKAVRVVDQSKNAGDESSQVPLAST